MANTLVEGPKHTLHKHENVLVATLDCQNVSKHCYISMQSILSIAITSNCMSNMKLSPRKIAMLSNEVVLASVVFKGNSFALLSME